MMNKKIFSLLMAIASMNAAIPTFCVNPENMIDDIIEVTIKLGQKQSYQNDIFMEDDQKKQTTIGITPNAQGEAFFYVDKAVYVDRQDGKEKNWGLDIPLVVQQHMVNQNRNLFKEDYSYAEAKSIACKLSRYRFPSSLPASIVQELQKNGSVECHNKWGHVVISLADYQPQPKSMFARFFALFTRTPDLKPDLKSVQSKAAQENNRTRKMFKEDRKRFVVPTWQE